MFRITRAYATGPGACLPGDPRDTRIAELESSLAGRDKILETLRDALADIAAKKLSEDALLPLVHHLLNPSAPTPQDIKWAQDEARKLGPAP